MDKGDWFFIGWIWGTFLVFALHYTLKEVL